MPGSWLRDHGTDVRYLPETDKAGNGRINNGRPDVGPYEYHTSGIIDRSVPGALPRIVKYTGPGALISLNAGPDTRTVVISDVTGRTAAVLEVKDGMAVLDPVRHGLPDGMYLVRTGDNTSLEKIILTR